VARAIVAPYRVALQEYGEPVLCSTDHIDLRALESANQRWRKALGLAVNPIGVEEHSDGLVKLRAEAVTGVIRVGDTDIEIAPKFLSVDDASWQSVLWHILTVVEGGYLDEDVTTAHELASIAMSDLLAEVFLTSYSRGAARGLPRTYVTEQAVGKTLRGSLDLTRTGQWLARPWEVPYVSDLLTDDTSLARLLRWTAECLASTVKTPARARALVEVAAALAHVGGRPPHLIDARRTSLGVQHQRLEAARVVGVLLLEGAGLHHAAGQHELSGFLWNSDTVYENYIFWLCRRAAATCGFRVGKAAVRFGDLVSGEGTRFETTPDVVFRSAQGQPVAVTDSKYKRLGSRPKAPDTYQVLTAGQVLGCQRVALTYPVDHDREATTWRVQSALGGADIALTALPLNFMALTTKSGPSLLIGRLVSWLENDLFDPGRR
jgi:5-methylcytosine-specific restriction endonuclease McrBC regulatory subunit McrC